MKKLILLSTAALLVSGAAYAQQMAPAGGALLSSVPSSSRTVTDWYKQDVYDNHNTEIGKVDDVLVGQDGNVSALIVGVGGFLGAGEKDVAVNFSAVKQNQANGKSTLTMDTTKDALNAAPGLKYDSTTTAWMPDNKK